MFNENWWIDKNNSKELAIGWLYNNQIGNDFASGYSKNLLDYWSIETSIYGMRNQIAANTEDEIIKKAHEEGYSKLLVIKQGTTFAADFHEEFTKFYDNNSDAKFVGHILDRGTKYYRIHPQGFLIDIDWWASVGSPKWGDWTSNAFTTIKPERSEENHHDQYTPLWVKGSDNEELCEYEGTEGGWSMVEALVKDKQKILSWSKEVRENKIYGYPEVKVDGPRHLNDVLNTCTPEDSFFIANTEYFSQFNGIIDFQKQRNKKWDGTFDHVMCPAAGLTPMVYGFNLGLKAGDRITIFDINKFAINMTNHIIEKFDGKDYTTLAYDLMEEMTPRLESDNDEEQRKREYADKFKGINKIKYSQELIDKLNKDGFSDWVQNVLPKIDVQSLHIDLFNVHQYNWFSREANWGETNFVHLSNIFHYLPTSFYYSSQQRWDLHNELVTKMKKESNTRQNNLLLSSARGLQLDPSSIKLSREYAGINWINDFTTTQWASLPENKLTRIFKWNQ